MILLGLIAIACPFLLYQLYKDPKKFFVNKEDYLMLPFLALIWIAFFYGFFKIRSFNHSMSYTFSIFCYYLVVKYLIRREGITILTLAKYAMISTIVCNLIVVVDWFLFNIVGVAIREHFTNLSNGTSNMTYYYQTFFYSVGGVGEEPGGTASLVNILFPIGLWYLYQRKKYNEQIFYILLHIVNSIFLASAAGIAFMLIALFVTLLLYKLDHIYKYVFYALVAAGIIFCIYQFDIAGGQEFLDKYASYMEEKITLSDRNASALDRKIKWQWAITDFSNSPFIGNGPGHGTEVHSTGYFNTYLTLLADTGMFTFIIFSIYYIIILIKLNALPDGDRTFFMFALLCQILHSSIYYVYYHEPFWFIFIMIQLLYEKRVRGETVDTPVQFV